MLEIVANGAAASAKVNISLIMPEGIIYIFKIIHIHHDNRDIALSGAYPFVLFFAILVKRGFAAHSGQRIPKRYLLHPGKILLQLNSLPSLPVRVDHNEAQKQDHKNHYDHS